MSYGKVHDVYWDDDKIERLSDRAALLGLFLITGPHRNAIGCFKLGIGAITDIPRFGRWGIEGASEALRELIGIGFIVRDEQSGWTFITNALKHDQIKQDKAAVHALSLTLRVPKTSRVYKALTAKLEPQLMTHSKALEGKEGWPLVRPIEGPSEAQPSPSPSPLPSPSPSPSPLPSDSIESESRRASAKRGTRLPDDWAPSPENIAFAVKEGFTEHDAARIAGRFKDYWRAQPGSRGVKLDWDATWRNWVRTERDRGGGSHTVPKRHDAASDVALAAEWAARNS